jgi:hypothetical protein
VAELADIYAAIDGAGRSRVGDKATAETIGQYVIVDEAPQDLADAAGLSLDVYSLARMIASENGSASAATLLALAESTRNEAERRGGSVTALLTRSSVAAAQGKYSEQAAGKWASTRLDPLGRHVEAARQALDERTNAFAGAVDFFDPSAQDKGQQGTHKLRKTSEQYIADRAAEGLAWIGDVDGVNAYHLMLFAPGAKPVDTTAALAALDDGRNGIVRNVAYAAQEAVGAVADAVGVDPVVLVIGFGLLALAALSYAGKVHFA